MSFDNPHMLNVCGIRLTNTFGQVLWWQSNTEHGTGWTERIRQAWTLRECGEQMAKIKEYPGMDKCVEIVEMIPGEVVKSNTLAPAPAVDWGKPIQLSGRTDELQYIGQVVPAYEGQCHIVFNRSNGQGYGCREDGTMLDSLARVINRPPAPRTLTVDIAAGTSPSGNMILTVIPSETHVIVSCAKNPDAEYGEWQTITLTLKGTP